MALSDGERVLPLATAATTSGSATATPARTPAAWAPTAPPAGSPARPPPRSSRRVLRPAVAGLAAEGRPFVGVLYAGLMLTPEGPQVLEFNARFGDPEAQVLLLRLEDDLLPAPRRRRGRRFRRRAASPSAARPRPASFWRAPAIPAGRIQGEPIRGLDRAAAARGVEIFHAGTALDDGELVSARRPGALRLRPGADLRGALERAYAAVGEIDWPGKVYRHDIGRRLLDPDRGRRYGTVIPS